MFILRRDLRLTIFYSSHFNNYILLQLAASARAGEHNALCARAWLRKLLPFCTFHYSSISKYSDNIFAKYNTVQIPQGAYMQNVTYE